MRFLTIRSWQQLTPLPQNLDWTIAQRAPQRTYVDVASSRLKRLSLRRAITWPAIAVLTLSCSYLESSATSNRTRAEWRPQWKERASLQVIKASIIVLCLFSSFSSRTSIALSRFANLVTKLIFKFYFHGRSRLQSKT